MPSSEIGIKVSCSSEKFLSRFSISRFNSQVVGDGPPTDEHAVVQRSKSERHHPNKVSRNQIEEEIVWRDINDVDALGIAIRHVGHMGRYQKLLCLCMLPFGVLFSYLHFSETFILVYPPYYWCRVPELANLTKETRYDLIAPKKRMVVEGARTYYIRDSCTTFHTNWTEVLYTLLPPATNTPLVPCQHGWDFQFTYIPYETVVTERGWVCVNHIYAVTAQAFFFLGSGAGGLVIGYLADKYGRVPLLVGANLLGCVGGIATVFTNGAWDFIACLFVMGMAYDNAFTLMYIIVIEYVGPKNRTWVAPMSTGVFIGMGCISLPWLALWIADWRKLMLVTSVPLLLVVFVPLFVPESARWLVKRGRIKDAVKVLHQFERVNRKKIPPTMMRDFLAESRRPAVRITLTDLIRSMLLRNTMIMMLILHMAVAIVCDGLVRLCETFSLNFFIVFTISAASQIPAVILLMYLFDKWGRKYLAYGPLAIVGALSLVAMFSPKGIIGATAAIISRFFITISQSTINLWATELLPTAIRASGLSTLHVLGHAAAVFSPFVIYSKYIWRGLPFMTLSIVAFICSGIAMGLPETKVVPTPEELARGENMATVKR